MFHLISECSRSVPSSNCIHTSVLCKLKDNSLTIWPSRLNNDILRVFNCNNNPSSKLELLPCLAKLKHRKDNINVEGRAGEEDGDTTELREEDGGSAAILARQRWQCLRRRDSTVAELMRPREGGA
ncbi:hypothetical protein Ahy_B06g084530 [Arachis hypogaea]|uniref:Uncharacterized protein n=1 Tax=Arachis hypogaea TaxID=3818 RepID=A0A444YS70_ARAHY|nr:hypothetical protein Ahy_B06g084530 [Arachis hypogaea]